VIWLIILWTKERFLKNFAVVDEILQDFDTFAVSYSSIIVESTVKGGQIGRKFGSDSGTAGTGR
jgi:hypothetical protein